MQNYQVGNKNIQTYIKKATLHIKIVTLYFIEIVRLRWTGQKKNKTVILEKRKAKSENEKEKLKWRNPPK